MKPYLILLIVTLFFACQKESVDEEILEFEAGKNHFLVQVEGVEREFYVHVPSSYSAERDYPVVFMLHGSSGNGLKFYNISGWKEVGEKEGIITVYPSSGRYCIVDDGKQKNTTKWNTYRGSWEFCDEESALDDVAFLKEIVRLLDQSINVDVDRIYLAGFSNGGRMAAKCLVEMSDVFAAITQNSGSNILDTVYYPEFLLPTIIQFGNSEKGLLEFNNGDPFPIKDIELLLEHEYFSGLINTHINTLILDPEYELIGEQGTYACLVYKGKNEPEIEFRFCLIKDMEHNYPNGINHPFKGAEHQWEWFKQYAK